MEWTAGDALKKWRTERGMTIAQAAAQLGVTRQCYWRWEARCDKHKIGLTHIHAVSKITGLPMRDLRPDRFRRAA